MNQTVNTPLINKGNKSLEVIFKSIHKKKIVKIFNKDSINCNRKNKKSNHNLNNFHMVSYFNKKYNLTITNLLSTIESKIKTIKKNSLKINHLQTNPKIKMPPNNSQFIQDHLKKSHKYSNHPDKSQLIPDSKIMLEVITEILL